MQKKKKPGWFLLLASMSVAALIRHLEALSTTPRHPGFPEREWRGSGLGALPPEVKEAWPVLLWTNQRCRGGPRRTPSPWNKGLCGWNQECESCLGHLEDEQMPLGSASLNQLCPWEAHRTEGEARGVEG